MWFELRTNEDKLFYHSNFISKLVWITLFLLWSVTNCNQNYGKFIRNNLVSCNHQNVLNKKIAYYNKALIK